MDRELELEVICGTYEEFVVGYQLYTYSGKENVVQFEQTFADHSHTASVRTVACRGELLASGGADEIVQLYNLRRRAQTGQLMDHRGTVTCLQFHGGHHLLSGSEDGRVAVVRVDSWQCERYLGRHPGGVTALAVHPSGRLALTAGRDRKLLTWDLVRARVAFRTNLRAAAEFVLWSPGGSTYAVGVQGRVDVYSVATAGVVQTIESAGKINCAVYISDSALACGDESGEASLSDVSQPAGGGGRRRWSAHGSRLRAITAIRRDQHTHWIVTCSSDGWIKLWETTNGEVVEPRLVASYNTTCRLTSVTVYVPPEKVFPPAQAATLAAETAERAAETAERAAKTAERAAEMAERAARKAFREGTVAGGKRKRDKTEPGPHKAKRKKADDSGGSPKNKKKPREGDVSTEKKKNTKKQLKAMKTKQKSLKKVQKATLKGLKALSLKKKKSKTKTKTSSTVK